MPSSAPPRSPAAFIGLMSGTSLDGVDGVLATFQDETGSLATKSLAHVHLPFAAALKDALMALQTPGDNEIDREAQAANELARCYAGCVAQLLSESGVAAEEVCAVGVHGQTIRHRPERGYTRQTNNPALLAELCGIDVIADFRSRDIAAGGQGAPLVPAFHQAAFGTSAECRVLVNIGGIANISVLDPRQGAVTGFDTGPGNVLMDLWALQHLGTPFDEDGRMAASGKLLPGLLGQMLAEPYFGLPAPKSTGRDLFHHAWLAGHLGSQGQASAADVQCTLAELTAVSIAQCIARSAPAAKAVFVCGGGARNGFLLSRIAQALRDAGVPARVTVTDELGIPHDQVESVAFAWLARQFVLRQPGNLPAVTGAAGLRVLGALYPAG